MQPVHHRFGGVDVVRTAHRRQLQGINDIVVQVQQASHGTGLFGVQRLLAQHGRGRFHPSASRS
ncbi:MAG: hypothetical protein ACRDQH_18900 [Pseudonocardiaceae bacterium]